MSEITAHLAQSAITGATHRRGLLRKMVLFSSLVTIVPVIIFVSRVIPAQRQMLLDNLESQTKSLAASIYEITVASIIAEDYSPVIEQCNKIVKESPSLKYIVITRQQDGFSLVITKDGWRERNMAGNWQKPPEADRGALKLVKGELVPDDVLHFAYPIVYVNWDWGWIHLGISPTQFRNDLASIYRNTIILAIVSVLIGVTVAFYFARRLTRPILMLSQNLQKVAAGDLSVRVHLETGDETESLAETFNIMTGSLERSNAELTAAKNYTENIIRSTIGMLIVLEPDGCIRFLNRSALVLLQYKESDLLGQPFSRIFVDRLEGTNGSARTTLDTIMIRGMVHCLERDFRRKDGQIVPALLSASKMQNDGAVEAIVCSAVDITELKQAALELERLHRDLVDASRVAGMAEVANNVLHNVGNVLNSVNVSTELLRERLRESKGPALERVAKLLGSHMNDLTGYVSADPIGSQIIPYLDSLSSHMSEQQQSVQEELVTLADRINHIKEIVAMQQNYSKIFGIEISVEVESLVEDALRMNQAALVRHEVSVERDYQKAPPITVDKHKVLQILVNLIRNAKYALDDKPRTERKLRLGIERLDEATVQIKVADNGVGMAPEVLQHLFEHGFTTRKNGNGFGLHSSILAARALGGNLSGESAGPGQGATFTLQIPISRGATVHV